MGEQKGRSRAKPAERWDVDNVSGAVRVTTPRPMPVEVVRDASGWLENERGSKLDMGARENRARRWDTDAETGVTRCAEGGRVEARPQPRPESERARQLLEPLRESDPHDLLTGLLNWGHFAMSLHEAVEYAKREGRALTLILLDIDYLDRIRVHHGSHEVTRLLVEVAAVCLRELTEKELVGRFAQCRLGILLSPRTPSEAAEIAERVLVNVRQQVRFGAGVPVTLSAGCASLRSVIDQSTGGLIDLAEQRLEEAGDMGGNQVIAAGRFWQDEPA